MLSTTSLGRYVRITLLMHCAALLVSAPAFGATVDIKKSPSDFSMEFRDADIKDVLRAVGQAAHLNMIVGDTVSGTVSLSLKNVSILDALEAILKTKGLTYVRDANILRVVAFSDVRAEDMETRVFPLGYADGKETLGIVEKLKSDKARVSSDTRMNAIVVKDLSLNLDKMERLLKNLDTRTPQVLIEAQIVEVSSNYTRELGIQWGGKYTGNSSQITGGATGNATSVAGSSVAAIGSNTFFPLTGDIGLSGNAYVVNLPAAVGAGAGGALGMTFGRLGGRRMLDLQLSAMQSTGNGKILSNPKVMTANNKEAKISSGIDIPVRTVSSTAVGSTSSVQIISASLMLSTTPVITKDNRIAMVVKVEKSQPDFTRQVDGIPTIIKQSANSELVVSNGETIVLGGIYTKNEGNTEASVPFLSKIPVIGWLFRNTSKFDNKDELLIFITPTIVQAEPLSIDPK
jgi:type IV pilus assembly protein PilQ